MVTGESWWLIGEHGNERIQVNFGNFGMNLIFLNSRIKKSKYVKLDFKHSKRNRKKWMMKTLGT